MRIDEKVFQMSVDRVTAPRIPCLKHRFKLKNNLIDGSPRAVTSVNQIISLVCRGPSYTGRPLTAPPCRRRVVSQVHGGGPLHRAAGLGRSGDHGRRPGARLPAAAQGLRGRGARRRRTEGQGLLPEPGPGQPRDADRHPHPALRQGGPPTRHQRGGVSDEYL